MTNSDRLQEIREQVEKAPSGLWEDMSKWLLQLVTDQQKEIARVRRTVSTLVGGMCEHKNNCQYPNCNCGQTGDPGSAFGTPGIPD